MSPADRPEGTAKIVLTGELKVGSTGSAAGDYELTIEGEHLVVAVTTGTSMKVRIPIGSAVEAIRELNTAPLTAWLRKWSSSQMALHDSGVARDDEDRPSTAVAQLRELVEWLSRDGKDDVSGLAADLAESIAITYGVE